jgi:hypothetical protein
MQRFFKFAAADKAVSRGTGEGVTGGTETAGVEIANCKLQILALRVPSDEWLIPSPCHPLTLSPYLSRK